MVNALKIAGTKPGVDTCIGCGRSVRFAGDKYCSDCGCRWCGGDAREGSVDARGRAFCCSECEDTLHRFMKAESLEA